MAKTTFSKKWPVALAIAWLVISVGSFFPVWSTIRPIILSRAPTPNIAYIYWLGGSLFSVAMMAVIRFLSKKAQITWLAILSKILMIFYSVSSILGVLVLSFLALKGWL